MTRILHVTDFHYRKHWYRWLTREAEKVDLVVISGDLVDAFPRAKATLREQTNWVSEWCQSLPCRLAICSGNHDVVALEDGAETTEVTGQWLTDLRQPDRIFVDRDDVHFGGFRVVVWPWAGGFSPMPDGRPTLLISHAGPAFSWVSRSDVGEFGDVPVERFLRGLTAPSWALSGHVHERHRWCDLVGCARCSNPGVGPWSAPQPNFVWADTAGGFAVFNEWNGEVEVLKY